ncbi:MAG: hypothetical protein HUJ52_00180, partial [Malacoplasma sp.]|nr:hypothetical protein [Malacoplasma sp.]
AFYIKEVKQQSAGWPIILSRADAGLVVFLLKSEVPEIQEGIVEIVDIQRIAGFKTKLAVISHQPGVEPCGTIIGPHGSRISGVKSQICNESIEVFEYDDDFEKYLVDVCSPARIVGYKVLAEATEERKRQLVIIVPPDQLPLLVGRRGANIRLITQLLKSDVDVKTPDDAKYDDIEYNRVETKSIQQRRYERIYSQNTMGVDDFSTFNKPKKVVVKKEEPTPVVAPIEQPAKPVSHKKPVTPSVQNSQSSTASLLDSIDSFDFSKTKQEAEEPIAETSSEDKFSALKASEAERQSTGVTSSLEDVFDTKQPKKQTKKTKKPSHKKVTIETNTTSILDEFKDKDSDALLQELVSENSSREEDSDESSDEDYDYEE